MNKLKFARMDLDLQSNNRYHNIPSIILTVSGCNLKCITNGELCKYAFSDKNRYSTEDAKRFINKHQAINHIVIQGGEPLMYKEQLEKFLDDIWRDDLVITIYTNGTLPILNPLANKYKIALYVVNIYDRDLVVAGSKITNPVTNKEIVFGTSDIEKMKSVDITALRNICMYSNDYLLCFKTDPYELETYSNQVVKEICETNDEFVNRFFENHPPQNNIVFSPIKKSVKEYVKQICLKTGKPYNEFKEK